jgi:ribosomal protein S18 acetylase RimI-like enzyme
MDITISPLTIAAYDAVIVLWQQIEGIGLSSADSRENIQAYLERNPGMSFVAQRGGEVMGAVLGGHDGRRGYIHHLAVRPDCRRQGLGRALVDRCLSALQQVGIQKCHLFVLNTNLDGLHFWENAGWTRRADLSVMSKNIEPAAMSKCC